jgi:hypothetical protein
MLTIVTPAPARLLTTRETLKLRLKFDEDPEEEILDALALEASDMIATHCDRVFGKETVREQFRLECHLDGPLILARRPVVSIVAVTEAGTALAATDYEIDKDKGLLTRLSGDEPACWRSGKILVDYSGGWILPGWSGQTRNLPADVESACIELVKMLLFSAERDPFVEREASPGVADITYGAGAGSASLVAGGLPDLVRAMLAGYVRPSFA